MEIRIIEGDKLYTDPAEWLAHRSGVSRIGADFAL